MDIINNKNFDRCWLTYPNDKHLKIINDKYIEYLNKSLNKSRKIILIILYLQIIFCILLINFIQYLNLAIYVMNPLLILENLAIIIL